MSIITWYAQGVVAAPAGADNSPATYGYDNGGFFGPQFANLGGDAFTVRWTGRGRDGDCSPPPAQIPASAANAPGSCLGW
jgi:hypothetical protein